MQTANDNLQQYATQKSCEHLWRVVGGGCLPLDASEFLVRLAADLHVGAVECAHARRDPRPAYRARGTPSRPSGDALGMEGMLTAKSDDN